MDYNPWAELEILLIESALCELTVSNSEHKMYFHFPSTSEFFGSKIVTTLLDVTLLSVDRKGMAKHVGDEDVALSFMEKRDETMVPLEDWCNHRKRLITELRSISPLLNMKTYPVAAICTAALIGAGTVAVVGYFYPELAIAGVLILGGIAVVVVIFEVLIKKERKRNMYRALELLSLDVFFTSEFIKAIAPHTEEEPIVLDIEERLSCRKDFKSAVWMKVYHAWKALETPHHTANIYVPNLPEISELLRNYADNAKGECEDIRRMMTENTA
ncbi:unnamed protein product [Cylicocyclus nassatus]|uniref:Uncharacterized protein n=1 Tax=Cylicocyclus nassatus TaxID=53992 RepID=A0AA36DM00_CYLNA|nr:unnamed protein product [Cylicocyclus nassatus]